MSEELKPCPFCGNEQIAIHHGSLYKQRIVPSYWCSCMDCNASTSVFMCKQEAIEAWNRRSNL